jgi:hypothetical protein
MDSNLAASQFDLRQPAPTWRLVRIRATGQVTEMVPQAAHRWTTSGQAEYVKWENGVLVVVQS